MPDEISRIDRPTVPPLPDPTLNELRRLRIIVVTGFVVVLAAIAVARIVEGPIAEGTAYRPECPHDPGYQTIAGQYTSVPEYHDCQRLVIRDGEDGQLVYSEMVALFLSKDVIEGRLSGTAFTAAGEVSETQGEVPLPRGIDLPGGVINAGFSAQFQSTGTPSGVRVIGSDNRDLGEAVGFVIIPWVQAVADMDYEPLGLKKGFNCMYFRAALAPGGVTIGVEAKMVFADTVYADCSQEQYKRRRGKRLSVTANGSGSIPKAARWDWSSIDESHVIGVPCPTPASVGLSVAGAGTGTTLRTATTQDWEPGDWCDVGSPTAVGSQPHGTEPYKAVKGWSDEQFLADPSADGPVRTDVMGTVFPVAGLSQRTQADYDTGFATVAYVALRVSQNNTAAAASLQKYNDRFGFHAVDPAQPFADMATIALCYGRKDSCFTNVRIAPSCTNTSTGFEGQPTGLQWWARTQSANKTKTKYFCVVYRGHPQGFKMPGVVRWRWHPNPGETNWISCPEGCCEVGG